MGAFGLAHRPQGVHQDGLAPLQYGLYLIPDIGNTNQTNSADGFVVITAPERISADGTFGKDRWDVQRRMPAHTNLWEYLVAFFESAPEGRYRFFAIAVTHEEPETNSAPLSWFVASKLFERAGSSDHLPAEIADEKLGDARVHVYAYIYQRESLESWPHAVDDGPLSLQTHIEKAGIQSLLKESAK